MTTEEIIAYQQALYVVASAAAEKVRRQGGSAREIAEAFGAVRQFCGWPEPDMRHATMEACWHSSGCCSSSGSS